MPTHGRPHARTHLLNRNAVTCLPPIPSCSVLHLRLQKNLPACHTLVRNQLRQTVSVLRHDIKRAVKRNRRNRTWHSAFIQVHTVIVSSSAFAWKKTKYIIIKYTSVLGAAVARMTEKLACDDSNPCTWWGNLSCKSSQQLASRCP